MSVDVQGLRRTIRNIEAQVSHLNAEVARLRKIADDAEGAARSEASVPSLPIPDLADIGLTLPPVILAKDRTEIVAYLRRHSDMTGPVEKAAQALVDEFGEEPSEIELVLYRDPEIEDRTLTFYVRVPTYDDAFMARIDKVYDRLDDVLARGSEMILITTDHLPIA